MLDYERIYFQLAAKVVDAINILIEAQQQGERGYIEGERPILIIAKGEEEKKD
ncbi:MULTISPECIES: hypothetical protein [unclassified Dehalobacter]|uniref:hypothetical protein n=1 Tax=unclassified Dehalobacter TaxID=2635733 RepID=UPI001404AC9C|nr:MULTISPECIES: hypothetical protein [unclassified Dehalobacter]